MTDATATTPATEKKLTKTELKKIAKQEARTKLKNEFVEGVIQYAENNYDSGWDHVVEAWTKAEIFEAIGWAESVQGAVRKMKPYVTAHNDRRAEIEATAF